MNNHEQNQLAQRGWLAAVRRFLSSLRPREIALKCVAGYASVTLLSIVVTHFLLVAWPQSGWGERIIAPVTKGLLFLDAHWKSALMLIAPFVVPVARDLIPRLRKVGSVEFDSVKLEPVGVREKPSQLPPAGDVQ